MTMFDSVWYWYLYIYINIYTPYDVDVPSGKHIKAWNSMMLNL